MTTNYYFRLQLKNVPRDQSELISLWAFEAGASGTAEVLAFQQNPLDYSVQSTETPNFDLDVFFAAPPRPQALEEFRGHWPQVGLQIQQEANRDWMAEWKKGFEAFRLVDSVWVVPSWREPPKEAQKIIRLDPGMAFGTGTHETTRLAAELLLTALKTRPGARVLDVGTGTGILAFLARLEGAARIVATDVDPEAVRVAKENLAANDLHEISISETSLDQLHEPFDVVVANIIDGVLVLLQKDLKRLVADGGSLILSGILDERLADFTARFRSEPLKLAERAELGEWRAWRLER